MTWHQINEGREDHRVIMMTLGGCSCICRKPVGQTRVASPPAKPAWAASGERCMRADQRGPAAPWTRKKKESAGHRKKGDRERDAAAPRPRAAVLAYLCHSSPSCLYLPLSHEPWLRQQFVRSHRWSPADFFLPPVALPCHNPLRKINKQSAAGPTVAVMFCPKCKIFLLLPS
jgi:hypothetical protein